MNPGTPYEDLRVKNLIFPKNSYRISYNIAAAKENAALLLVPQQFLLFPHPWKPLLLYRIDLLEAKKKRTVLFS